jgi:ankyrin repeat protein
VKQALAGLPAHLPFVVGFMALVVLLFALNPLRVRPRRMGHLIGAGLFGLLSMTMFSFALAAYLLHQDSGFEQLMDAVDRGEVEGVRAILATKDHAIVNWRRGEGGGKRDNRPVTFPLLVAAQRNLPEITRMLLAAGADPKPVDRQRRTALHFAVRADTRVMALLLDAGSSPEGSDIDGKSPLHLAVETGDPAPVELLLSRGASVRSADRQNASPLHYVKTPEIAALLCAHDAIPDWPDSNGATPQKRASVRGDAAMAAFLGPQGGPCVWLHTRPGVASATARATAVNEYRCEQLASGAGAPAERPRQAAACVEWAHALEKGDSELEADPLRARSAYARACDNGRVDACSAASRLPRTRS